MDESYRNLKQRIETCGASPAGGAGQIRGQPAEVVRFRQQTFSRMRRKINAIHVDFRSDLIRKYAVWRKNMAELFTAFEGTARPISSTRFSRMAGNLK